MILEVLDPKELTLEEAMECGDELYFVYMQDSEKFRISVPTFAAYNSRGVHNIKDDKILVRIIQDIPKEEPKKNERQYNRRTYKLDTTDPNNIVEVESRVTGEIRVNFNDKESAELYRKHIAKLFYKSTTGADWLSVSTIYKELKVVNWKPEDCDDWVYPTIYSGTLRHISEVTKTKGKNKFGFTLSAPKKIDAIN